LEKEQNAATTHFPDPDREPLPPNKDKERKQGSKALLPHTRQTKVQNRCCC